MNWREIHDGQNLRLTQKMLEQQGEINRLKAELRKVTNLPVNDSGPIPLVQDRASSARKRGDDLGSRQQCTGDHGAQAAEIERLQEALVSVGQHSNRLLTEVRAGRDRLAARVAELEVDSKKLHQGIANLADANTAITSELAETRAAASRREGYLQLQAEGQLQASSSWQREAHRLRGELEKLTNPDDADCECGEEYAEQDCPVHGVMRLLLDLRVEHAKARAEIERLREHSATLNAIAWKMGAALGDVPAGVEQIEGSPTGLTERLISEIERLRAELATPCSDIREGLFGVILTCERNLGHGGMHHDAESGAGWTYNGPSSQ